MKRVLWSLALAVGLTAISTVVRVKDQTAYTMTFDCDQPSFVRDAAPQWETIDFDGISVGIPYSNDWNVERPECLWQGASYNSTMYDVFERQNDYGESWRELTFGRPTNNLSNIGREYHLTRQEAPAALFDVVPSNWSCLNSAIETPKEIVIGGSKGWRYFVGGAKWCEMVVEWKIGNSLYTLGRNLEPKWTSLTSDDEKTRAQALSEIDLEMQRIIESITE